MFDKLELAKTHYGHLDPLKNCVKALEGTGKYFTTRFFWEVFSSDGAPPNPENVRVIFEAP